MGCSHARPVDCDWLNDYKPTDAVMRHWILNVGQYLAMRGGIDMKRTHAGGSISDVFVAESFLWRFRYQIHGALRIVAGYAFMLHGAQKIFGILGAESPVDYLSLRGLAGVIELVGGALIMVGLFTSLVAFLACGLMATAYFMGHVAPNGGLWAPLTNGGETAVLYCFIFLFLAAAGGGAMSLDRLRSDR